MTSASPPRARPPAASVIMANHNGAAYLAQAIASVGRQSLSELELIVSDDASTDDSARIIDEAIADDPRIRLIRSAQNSGPAAARNKALALARGAWIAVMDSDDLMHPDRLKSLIVAAEREGADIVADDLIEFESDSSQPSRRLLCGRWARAPFWVDIKEYVKLNEFYGTGPGLGYLKPVVRASSLRASAMRYDESLRIGEDFDLVLRLLYAGQRFRVYPLQLYYYRKHGASISHRLNESALVALKAANLRFLERLSSSDRALAEIIKARSGSIDMALAFEKLLTALKTRNWIDIFRIIIANPSAAALLRLPLGVRLRRLLPTGR
jgi:glycosyltransferase involved in cell wall biosynthesis